MMKRLLFFIFTLSMACLSHAAGSFSTVEERMTAKEFSETGLVKLTGTELAALDEWLRRHSVATLENDSAHPASGAAMARTTQDLRGFDKRSEDDASGKDPELIQTNIIGSFSGWDRKGTLFKLANGMVWQQSEKDTFFTQPVDNPKVTIEKGFMGIWHLSLVGHDDRVRVKRVE